ncbi:xanthine dehydrogenase family protein molybdopterin-binding subunit [Salipiger pacificus]|nr:xanthine dehydrogenase family protein molybdopterin-binding subunit [Alloyangia pacifica]
MEFNEPAGQNLFDTAQIIGKPTARVDGPLKVSGLAPYAYERHDVVEGQLYGYPVGATISHGRILSMDVEAARAAPGVRAVVTTLEIAPLALGMLNVARLFGGDEVQHYHQAIAVVVADSFEQARAAADLITAEYERGEAADFDLRAAFERLEGSGDPDTLIGDVDTAFRSAAAVVDQRYHTAPITHAAMEPHASIVDWSDGGRMRVWTSNQMINWTRNSIATTFGIDPELVQLESPYVGGGFGGKLWLRSDAVLAAIGSRAAGAPVKLALPRPFVMNNTTHRAATVQRVRLAAASDGRLTGVWHEAASHSLPGGRGENATAQTPYFYATDTMRVKHHIVAMPLPEASDMRAPGEASGHMGLEVAMDELAEALQMDPVQLRIVNDTQVNPSNPSQPFSERNYVACLERGAAAFGWSERNAAPGQHREGQWLIGMGMAGAYRGAPVRPSGARAILEGGRLIIETDMTDIGTGSYTILAQTAAEVMGLGLDDVEMRLGSSLYPVSSGSGGQFGAASSTAGVYAACMALRREIGTQLGLDAPEFRDGQVVAGDSSQRLADLDGRIEAVDEMTIGEFQGDYLLATFGAHFAEVAVHIATGETRVRRMVSAIDAGRILNPTTARSQLIGGMTMSIGGVLSEEMALDTGRGYFANHDLAGYEVAVHADILNQEVIFLDTADAIATPLKAKGVGELGVCGVGAAVANAVYNATGVRVRDFPLTLDRLLDGLPELA